MHIQNISNPVQAPQPARLPGKGAPDTVVAAPSNVAARPSVAVELPPATVKQTAEPQPSAENLKNAVDNINKTLKETSSNLQFSVDTDTKKLVVKLIDTETADVIRQFPSKEMLAIARSIDQFQQGLLLRQKA